MITTLHKGLRGQIKLYNINSDGIIELEVGEGMGSNFSEIRKPEAIKIISHLISELGITEARLSEELKQMAKGSL